MNRFSDARDRCGAFLLRQIRNDGRFGDPTLGITEYYKVPSALLVCGFSAAANKLLDWIRRNEFLPNGDFGPRPETDLNSYYYTYYNTWVIKGACRNGAFDIANRGMDFLLTYQDSSSGGFYSHLTKNLTSNEQDLWVVSGIGWASIYTGRLDIAKGIGNWLQEIMISQPNYPSELWTVFDAKIGLITEVKNGDDFRYVLTRDESRDQSFYHPGIAAGFLCQLYMATEESKWLDLAQEYMLFCEYVGDYHFKLLRAGKVGWAAGLLYTLTKQNKYLDMAIKVGDNLIDKQLDSGAWPWLMSGQIVPHNDITAEMTVWLDEIYQATTDY